MNEFLENAMNFLQNSTFFNSINDEKVKELVKYLDNNNLYKIKKNCLQNDDKIYYFQNCQLISEESVNLLFNNNQNIKIILNEFLFEFIFGGKVILLLLNENINIGHLENDIFKPEIVIKTKEEKNLNGIIKKIKYFGLN